MKKIFVFIFSLITIIVSAFFAGVVSCDNFKDGFSEGVPFMGVWWWNDRLDYEEYLSFAKDNGINEIYYCTGEFGEDTSEFIGSARNEGMSVYWLQGEYQWLDNFDNILEKIEEYCDYQENYPNCKFSGIHLDVEPHQSPEFDENRELQILKLIELANSLKEGYPDIKFDYDIPFWLDDEITFNDVSKPAYKHMIDVADRVFVMSYRDTADAIKDIAKEELDYAKLVGKKIFLSVETYSSEGDKVSFMEEGKSVMMAELDVLKEEFDDSVGYAIHHIKSWYELKE